MRTYLLRMVYKDIHISLKIKHGNKKRQVTDFIWSKNMYRLDRTVEDPDHCVLYYLQGGPDRTICMSRIDVYSRGLSGTS